MKIDLTNYELFKSFSEFECSGVYIDLHNEFDCKSIIYLGSKRQLMLSFKPNKYNTLDVSSVEIVFKDCIIEQYSAKLDKSDTDSITIDMMYRGRYEMSDSKLGEVSDTGLYYYIRFLPDVNIELFAKCVIAQLEII